MGTEGYSVQTILLTPFKTKCPSWPATRGQFLRHRIRELLVVVRLCLTFCPECLLRIRRAAFARQNDFVSVATGRLIAGSGFSYRMPPTPKAPRPARYTGAGASGRHPRPRKGLRPPRHRSCRRQG